MVEFFKRLLGNPRFLVIAGYVLFMLLFYFIGITSARFMEFVTIGILTGFYALVVLVVKKIDKG